MYSLACVLASQEVTSDGRKEGRVSGKAGGREGKGLLGLYLFILDPVITNRECY